MAFTLDNFRFHDTRIYQSCVITRLPLVSHICVSESRQHSFRLWLADYSAPSHYLNTGLLSIGPLGKNYYEIVINTTLFMHESASENIDWCDGGHFVQGRWVKNLTKSVPVENVGKDIERIPQTMQKHLFLLCLSSASYELKWTVTGLQCVWCTRTRRVQVTQGKE